MSDPATPDRTMAIGFRDGRPRYPHRFPTTPQMRVVVRRGYRVDREVFSQEYARMLGYARASWFSHLLSHPARFP